MQPWAESFYKSKEWKKCRASYAKSRGNLCELCLKRGYIIPGVIVHHKVHLTPENISDPTVTLNWDNLQLVCRDCHAEIHTNKERRYKIDELGHVIIR